MKICDLTYEQCVAQGIGPLVFPDRLADERKNGLTEEVRKKMKAVCVYNIQTQVHIYRIQEQAWRALEAAGIEAVLMKGAGLAALYPSPEMRQWGDVDIYVGKEQYHAAAKVMRETFPNALKFEEELDHYKHYNLIADGVSIEIHRVSVSLTHPIDVHRYAKMEAYGMKHGERIKVKGLEVTVPEPTFNVLMVFLHSWEHVQTRGANLRQLYDLALLIDHYKAQLDWNRLKRWLRALHIEDVWHLYLNSMLYCLGIPALTPELTRQIPQERVDRLVSVILQGGMGTEESHPSGKTPRNRFVRKWRTMHARLNNAKRIAECSPSYARHTTWGVLLNGAMRLFAKDRHWE